MTPPLSERVIPVACAVLADPSGRILAVQRGPGRALAGLWEFPGGKVEAGEKPEDALRRELIEELALDPAGLGPFRPLAAVVHAYAFATIELIPFLVPCPERPPLSLVEHADHRWLPPEEAESLDWAPADLPVLAQLESRG